MLENNYNKWDFGTMKLFNHKIKKNKRDQINLNEVSE